MFRTIFSKTIYEKRWAMLWWTIAMFAMTLLIVVLFPTFQSAFGQTLKDVPDSLKQILGSASDYQRIEGFLHLQVFMQMIFLTVIYGVILGTGLIAGDEGQGTLQTLLAQPVSRFRIYFEKLAASAVILWIVNLGMFVAIWIGCIIISQSIDYYRLFVAVNALWLVSMVFSLVGFALGSVLGKRGIAGALAGAYAFLSYIINSLVDTVHWFRYPNYLSPIKYFTSPRILDNGVDFLNILVLAIACVVLAVSGFVIFNKRDISSK